MNIPIYCINMKASTGRKERMLDRFKIMNILDDVIFVEGITKDDDIVNYYLKESPNTYADKKCFANDYQDLFMKDGACYASHIKAVRTFLYQNEYDECLICEDDILLHNDFSVRLSEIIKQKPSNTPLISLSWMIVGPIDQTYITKNLWKIDSKHTWGAQCYYITRHYAKKLLDEFDRPWIEVLKNYPWTEKITSEIIIRESGGYMINIPLAIEDCINSDRAPRDLPYHIKYWCHWDYKNYKKCDPEGLSILLGVDVKNGYAGYPYSKKMLYYKYILIMICVFVLLGYCLLI